MIDPLGALAAWDLPLYNESRHQIAKGEKRASFGEPRSSLNRTSDARFRPALEQIIDMGHPLVRLAGVGPSKADHL